MLAESPLVQGRLYAGTDDGRVWTSPDDGGEWIELTGNISGVPEGTYVSRVEPSRHDPDRVYVSFDGHRTNDFTPYVQVSDDGGDTFRSIAAGLPTGALDFVHVVREDPRNENLLFVGTDLAVYASLDRGASWRRFMESMPTVPVHDLRIHPRDRELIAGTHGRSIWIVDIAPLQDLTMQVLADGAGTFEPAPAYSFAEPARGGESYGQAWFARPTPGVGGRISYYVGEDVAEELAAAAEAEAEANAEDEEAGAAGGAGGAGRAGCGGGAGRCSGPGGADCGGRAGGGRGGGPGGGPAGRNAARVEITITDADGEVVQTLSGPARCGASHRDVESAARDRAGAADAVAVRAARQPVDGGAREGGGRFAGGGGVGGGAVSAPRSGSSRARATRSRCSASGVGAGGSVGAVGEETIPRPSGNARVNRRRALAVVVGRGGGGGRFGGANMNQLRELAELIRPGMGMGAIFGRGPGRRVRRWRPGWAGGARHLYRDRQDRRAHADPHHGGGGGEPGGLSSPGSPRPDRFLRGRSGAMTRGQDRSHGPAPARGGPDATRPTGPLR